VELIVIIALFCLLGVLALRYGYDSGELPMSKERELAALGFAWQQHPHVDAEAASEVRAAAPPAEQRPAPIAVTRNAALPAYSDARP
jgi:hypothetical protein